MKKMLLSGVIAGCCFAQVQVHGHRGARAMRPENTLPAFEYAIAAGVVTGPRMLVSAHPLGARGGHCDLTGFPYNFFGREPGIAEGIASGPDQFRDAVRMQLKYGADLIKVCATGGVLSLADSVDAPQLTQAEMDAVVAYLQMLGTLVDFNDYRPEADFR